jgi:dTDP-glucose pyrophosphorylase
MRATLAVILARGLGTRLRHDDGASLSDAQQDAARVGAKGLMPIAGRPFLDYLLQELADGGVTDLVFVVAPDDVVIRDRYLRAAPPTRLRVHFAVQDAPRGTADALLAARGVVTGAHGAPRDTAGVRHFLLCNSDNLYPADAVRALVDLDGPGVIAFSAAALTADGLIERERVHRFALLDIAADGGLRDVVEKPDASHPLAQAEAQWVSMNLWRFTDAIFEDCAQVTPSPRQELELVDAVRAQLARGVRYTALPMARSVPDLTHRRDIATLEHRLGSCHPRP